MKERPKEPSERKADRTSAKETSGKGKESSTPDGATEGGKTPTVSEPSEIVESTPPSKPTGARATKPSATAAEDDKTEGARI